MFSGRRTLYPLLVPLLLIAASTVLIWKWPELIKTVPSIKELRAFVVILPVMPYAVSVIGILIGWRYNNIGLILSFLTLTLTYFTILTAGTGMLKHHPTGLALPEAVGFLLPLNLAIFSTLTKRRIFTSVFVFCFLLIVAQIVAVLSLCVRPDTGAAPLLAMINKFSPTTAHILSAASLQLASFFHTNPITATLNRVTPGVFASGLTIIFLLIRFLYTRNALQAGFCGALLCALVGMLATEPIPSLTVYFMAGGIILIIATFEASLSMAYIDELTGLQGRRSLNETLLNLGSKYAIAMIDVDHFKKFNDTYGHKTGDQVLKMIATRLEKVSGGAKTFRYGGEEFAAVFPGKTAEAALPYLEEYRQGVSATPFIVRGRQRRKKNAKYRGAEKNKRQKTVRVTVSIGAASPDKAQATPEKVIKTADKNLYKAKNAGRNRVVV